MKIQTKFFEEVEIDDKSIIKFEQGIPGFENLTKFTIFNIEDQPVLKCLQSIENKDICLLIASPWDYFKDYEIQIPDEELNKLNILSDADICVYSVIRVHENSLTANLIAPLVINIKENMGKQIILSNTEYNVRQEIICL